MAPHSSLLTPRGFFVTGTDTGVGKTLVACALLRLFVARGLKAVGMKPVAAGAEPAETGLLNEDVGQLVAAGNVSAPREHVNPYCFGPPIAPHIAAAQAGVAIGIDRIEASFRALAGLADVVIVEGAGGFRVPLGGGADTAQLAGRLALPVVLVVGMRLGCLNHALLTADAVRAAGLPLAGWIANAIDPDMPVRDENVVALDSRLGSPLLGRLPHSASPDARALAACLDVRALLA
jgi:dethiobiotin synthetase